MHLIKVKKQRNQKMIFISLEGHAGYAQEGYDIVCAAVSILFQNLMFSIKSLTTGELECKKKNNMKQIEIRNLSDQVELLVNSFFIGIQKIAVVYPENVRIV